MTAYNPAEVERLIAEARAPGVAAKLVTWIDEQHVGRDDDPHDIAREIRDEIDAGKCEPAEQTDKLVSALADQLEAARAEIAKLRAKLEHAREAYCHLGALDFTPGDVVDASDIELIETHLTELRAAQENS